MNIVYMYMLCVVKVKNCVFGKLSFIKWYFYTITFIACQRNDSIKCIISLLFKFVILFLTSIWFYYKKVKMMHSYGVGDG